MSHNADVHTSKSLKAQKPLTNSTKNKNPPLTKNSRSVTTTTRRRVPSSTLNSPTLNKIINLGPFSNTFASNNSNPSLSNPITTSKAGVTIKKLSGQERKHLKGKKKGRTVFVPPYVHAKDLSQRLHVTLMQLHKAGTHFFPWWPRASERQLKRDGYSMLADLVLRFDECHLLLKSLGYNPVFEHTGIRRRL